MYQGLPVPTDKTWWRDALGVAMEENPRVANRMLDGLKFVVIGLSVDLLGLPAQGLTQTVLVAPDSPCSRSGWSS